MEVSPRSLLWIRRIHLLAIIVFACVIGGIAVDGDPPAHDGEDNFLNAYNLANAGVFSMDMESGESAQKPAASNYREPLYPMLVAGGMRALLPTPLADLDCFRQKDTVCAAQHEILKSINIGLIVLMLVAFHVLVPRVSNEIGLSETQGVLATIALITFVGVGSSYLSKVEFYYSDTLAGLLAFLHSAALVLMSRRASKRWGILSGLTLGGLVLTKAIFLYWLVILCLVLGGLSLLRTNQSSRNRAAAMMLILFAVLPVLAWMTRNKIELDQFAVSSGRDFQVMGVRAEYDAMRWAEYLPGYVYFVPVYGWAAVADFFEEADYQRYVRERPDSFFTVGQSDLGLVGQQVKQGVPTYVAAASVFLEHLPMHMATTVLMTYRSFFIPAGVRTLRVKVGAFSHRMTMTTFAIHVTLVPSILLVSGIAAFTRRSVLLVFLAPALFSIALHAGVTHYIPRYNTPLIPLMFFSQFVLICHLWNKCRVYLAKSHNRHEPS